MAVNSKKTQFNKDKIKATGQKKPGQRRDTVHDVRTQQGGGR